MLGSRADEAASLLGEIGQEYSDDPQFQEAVSERVLRLLRLPGRLSRRSSRLRLADSAIPVPSVNTTVADRSGLLIWDSGAEATILDEALCSELGLESLARSAIQNAAGETVGGSYVASLPHDLALGPVDLDLPAVVCVDLAHAVVLEPRLLGVLGANALGAASYQLDVARGELTLGAALPPDLARLEAEFEDGMVYVQVLADGRTARLLLDTGADYSALAPDTIQRLGLSVTASGEERTVHQFGGVRLESGARTIVRQLLSGDESREGVEFRVGGDNLLGMDFLGNRRLVVDRDAGIVGISRVP